MSSTGCRVTLLALARAISTRPSHGSGSGCRGELLATHTRRAQLRARPTIERRWQTGFAASPRRTAGRRPHAGSPSPLARILFARCRLSKDVKRFRNRLRRRRWTTASISNVTRASRMRPTSSPFTAGTSAGSQSFEARALLFLGLARRGWVASARNYRLQPSATFRNTSSTQGARLGARARAGHGADTHGLSRGKLEGAHIALTEA